MEEGGRMEEDGRGWKIGIGKEWKDGRMEGWKIGEDGRENRRWKMGAMDG